MIFKLSEKSYQLIWITKWFLCTWSSDMSVPKCSWGTAGVMLVDVLLTCDLLEERNGVLMEVVVILETDGLSLAVSALMIFDGSLII